MRVLMTGGSGFIGRQLVQQLQADRVEVVLYGRPASLTDVQALRTALEGVEAVIHLAGLKGEAACQREISTAVTTNVLGTQAVVQASCEAGVRRFLFASTYDVYGRKTAEALPSREEDPLQPQTIYGMTKGLAEKIVQASPMPSTILRIGHVYGLDLDRGDLDVVSAFFYAALRNHLIRIHGAGLTRIDPILVTDVCEGIRQLLQTEPPLSGTFNMASGTALSIRETAETIRRCLQERAGPIRLVHDEAQELTPINREVSMDQIQKLLPSFRPKPLDQGLAQMAAALLAQPQPML